MLNNKTRGSGRPKEANARVDGARVELVPHSGSVKYLGRLAGFDRPRDVEINIASGMMGNLS